MDTLNDLWTDETWPDAEGDTVAEKRQVRERDAWVAGGSYLLDTIILGLFASAGALSPTVVLWYGVAGALITFSFVGLHRFGLAERRADPDLVVEQMLIAIAVQLVATYAAPILTTYFMGLLFLIFAFGMARLSLWQALLIWLATSAGLGATLYQLDFHIPAFLTTQFEGLLAWLAFSTILLRAIGVSTYANVERQRRFTRNLQLARKSESAKAMLRHDPLTGALNRHALLPMIEHQISLAGRSKEAFALCMLDLDHFKQVNEHYGQAIGDKVLTTLVKIARDILRTSDQIGRFGGEEFAVLLPGSSGHEAINVIERLRSGVENHDWATIAPGLMVRISAGIAPFSPGDSVEKLMGKADYGLYKAKHGGRNRVTYVGGE